MESLKPPFINKKAILALGAESAGAFAVYYNGGIFISENFGDLLDDDNFLKYKKAILNYCKKNKFKPNIVLSDLHPLFKTTLLGSELAKKYKVKHIEIQHHIAHIFSAVGDRIINSKSEKKYYCHSERSCSEVKNPVFSAKATGSFAFAQDDILKLPNTFFGIAMDGTGYGLDGNIWGGEVFKLRTPNAKRQTIEIERIGSLEEQVMIGGDAAVREPARMLIAILAKLRTLNAKRKIHPVKYSVGRNLTGQANSKIQKDFIYKYMKKFYTRNEFEALYNQMKQNFNCQKTTSTGRVLDAVAVLLGFAGNERNFKHEAAKKLEENSTEPYFLKPKISFSVIASSPSADGECGNPANGAINTGLPRRLNDYIETSRNDTRAVLDIGYLFEYLIKNIYKDKKRLAATAQLYIAKGLYEIIKKIPNTKYQIPNAIFAAGGLTNNKIISSYLERQGVYLAKKIPRGDERVSFGQIIYYLTNSWH